MDPTKAEVDALQQQAFRDGYIHPTQSGYIETVVVPFYGESMTITVPGTRTRDAASITIPISGINRSRYSVNQPTRVRRQTVNSDRYTTCFTIFDRLTVNDDRVIRVTLRELAGTGGVISALIPGNIASTPEMRFSNQAELQTNMGRICAGFRLSEGLGVDLSLGSDEAARFDYEALAETDPDGRVFLKDFSGNPIDWNAIAPLTSHGVEWVDDEYIYHTANITYRDPDGLYVFLENNERPSSVIRINR